MSDLTIGTSAVKDIVNTVKELPILKKEDANFLIENGKHLATVLEKSHMWRTDTQKRSILSDFNHPTLHSKYHQAILEQKVQFDQAMYLAKDFELKKLEIEELDCDLADLEENKRGLIKSKKIQIEIQFKQYELKNMQIAMDYRMKEVKGWQSIIDDLYRSMKEQGLDDDTIWSKEKGEVSSMFFTSLNNLLGVANSNDAGEVNNLVSIAQFAVQQTKQMGIFDKLKEQCNKDQLEYLKKLGE